MVKCISLSVSGLVQGVWYRKSAMKKALELELKGMIKNETDGSVYIEAEGKEDKLQVFEEWCKSGPPGAKVSNVIREQLPLKNYPNFIIKR